MPLTITIALPPSGRLGRFRRVDHRQLADADLVSRCAERDDRALAELYDRFGKQAYALALRVVRDSVFAEDAVQEAFLDVWRSAARFDAARAKVSSWLLTFVHRRAVDIVRREQARPQRSSSIDDAPPQVAAVNVAAEVESRDRQAAIKRALESLTPAQRDVLQLAYFGGYSQSEIAERLDEPLGTVKSRTHVALSRLRELLAGELHEL